MKLIPYITLICAFLPASFLTAENAPTPSAPALPLNFFKHLDAGKKQTVVVYGTSLTIKGAWSGALAEYLSQQYPDRITFFNTAKAGMDSDWGVANLRQRVLSHRPDLVFVEFSANDAALKNKISLEKSRANLDAIVNAIRAQNPEADIVLQTMNPAWDSPKNPAKLYGSDRPGLAAYYAIYRDYAREHHLPLVDNFPVWQKMLEQNPEAYHRAVSDGIHPHSGPSRSITWPGIKSLLEQARTKIKSL